MNKMNKKKFNSVVTMSKNGLGNTLCVAMILELGKDSANSELAEWIERFYFNCYENQELGI